MATKTRTKATTTYERVVSFEVENVYFDDLKALAHSILEATEIPDEATFEMKDTTITVTYVG